MEVPAVKESKYRVVHLAARRARQLQCGSSPSISTRSTKAVRVAQDELEAGVIDYVVPEKPAKSGELSPGYTPILHS